jgi:hypothetical protein
MHCQLFSRYIINKASRAEQNVPRVDKIDLGGLVLARGDAKAGESDAAIAGDPWLFRRSSGFTQLAMLAGYGKKSIYRYKVMI